MLYFKFYVRGISNLFNTRVISMNIDTATCNIVDVVRQKCISGGDCPKHEASYGKWGESLGGNGF